MSPRAAWRLDSLGFTDVFDYAAGKLDWLAAGLPTEGTNNAIPRIGALARADVPVCSLDERLGNVRERVRTAGWDVCVVVNEQRIVLGLLRANELDNDPTLLIEQAMRPGPSTYRPHVFARDMASTMTKRDLPNAPVTTSEGRLIGVLLREDVFKAGL